MSFEVLVEPAAEAEIEAAYDWLSSETSVDTAERWLDSILLAGRDA